MEKILNIEILGYYIFISLFTYAMYAIDKSSSIKGGWRISEKRLHILSLMGGWLGALVAQKKLRHKSQKQSFRVVFWLTVGLNITVLLWYFGRMVFPISGR